MKMIVSMAGLSKSVLAGSLLMAVLCAFGADEGAQTGIAAENTAAETNLPPVNAWLGSSLPPDIDPASPLGQLVRLVQAGVDRDVVLAYINNSPHIYQLKADDIVYLNDLGTPSDIIEAILVHDRQLIQKGIGPAEDESRLDEVMAPETNQPPEVTVDEFYKDLSPYGTWIYVEGYGRCWQPTVVVYNTAWRPYCDNGRWVYTDHGWYWQSSYTWGWAAFHYGRWFHHARHGWCWWPDTMWAPAWVCWRYTTDYCGWAPLPPRTTYRSGVGFVYRGDKVTAGFDFGLTIGSFLFVATKNFCDYDLRHCRVDEQDARRIYGSTRVSFGIDRDEHHRALFNRGIPPRDVAAAAQREIKPVPIDYGRSRAWERGHVKQMETDKQRLNADRTRPSPRTKLAEIPNGKTIHKGMDTPRQPADTRDSQPIHRQEKSLNPKAKQRQSDQNIANTARPGAPLQNPVGEQRLITVPPHSSKDKESVRPASPRSKNPPAFIPNSQRRDKKGPVTESSRPKPSAPAEPKQTPATGNREGSGKWAEGRNEE